MMHAVLGNIVVDYFLEGGPVMWPILCALVAGVTVVIERGLWWWGLRRRTREDVLRGCFAAVSGGEFEKAIEMTRDSADPLLRTVHEGLLEAHSSMLGAMQLRASDELEHGERRQWVLGTLITLAPLLGLL